MYSFLDVVIAVAVVVATALPILIRRGTVS